MAATRAYADVAPRRVFGRAVVVGLATGAVIGAGVAVLLLAISVTQVPSGGVGAFIAGLLFCDYIAAIWAVWGALIGLFCGLVCGLALLVIARRSASRAAVRLTSGRR